MIACITVHFLTFPPLFSAYRPIRSESLSEAKSQQSQVTESERNDDSTRSLEESYSLKSTSASRPVLQVTNNSNTVDSCDSTVEPLLEDNL